MVSTGQIPWPSPGSSRDRHRAGFTTAPGQILMALDREPMITMNAPFKRIKPAALSQQILALTGKLEVLAQAKRAPLEITGQHRLEQHWPAEETK